LDNPAKIFHSEEYRFLPAEHFDNSHKKNFDALGTRGLMQQTKRDLCQTLSCRLRRSAINAQWRSLAQVEKASAR
jgi:hypothetical protein